MDITQLIMTMKLLLIFVLCALGNMMRLLINILILIGANKISLKEAKENYKKYGVCKKDFLEYVREAFKEEK